MMPTFFIVGPTATAKSEMAADVSSEIDAELSTPTHFKIISSVQCASSNRKPGRKTFRVFRRVGSFR
jgi:hypothetical protein